MTLTQVPQPSHSSEEDRPAAATTSRQRWKIFAIVAIAPFIALIDGGVCVLAIPNIQRDMHMTVSGAQWVTDIYLLLFGSLQMFAVRLADRFGRRSLFLAGLTVFTLASLAVGAADTGAVLITMRALQAIGAAFTVPVAMAIVLSTFTDPAERQKAIGIWAGLAGLGGVAGVILGGALIDLADWRWAYYINVPVGAAVLLMALKTVPRDVPSRSGGSDVPGTVAVTLGLLVGVYGIVRAPEHGWTEGWTLASFAAAAVLLVGFGVWQRKAQFPALPPAVIGERRLATATLSMLFVAAASNLAFFIVGLHFQDAQGYTAWQAGLRLVPFGVGIIVFGGMTPVLVARIGARAVVVLGSSVSVAGFLWLALLTPSSGYFAVGFPGLCLLGAGVPLMWVVHDVMGTTGATEQTAGLASGIMQSAASVGGGIGVAVGMSVASSVTRRKLAHGATPTAALSHGFAVSFGVGALLIALGMVIPLVGYRRQRIYGRSMS